jgi:hypothetical protein
MIMDANPEKKLPDEKPEEKKATEKPNPAPYGRCGCCGAALQLVDGGDNVLCPTGCLV